MDRVLKVTYDGWGWREMAVGSYWLMLVCGVFLDYFGLNQVYLCVFMLLEM